MTWPARHLSIYAGLHLCAVTLTGLQQGRQLFRTFGTSLGFIGAQQCSEDSVSNFCNVAAGEGPLPAGVCEPRG